MESQDKEKQYEHDVWETYRKEFATANPEKQLQLNKRMLRWQELMTDGQPASQAYIRAMQEESDHRVMGEHSEKRPSSSFRSRMRIAPLLVFLSLAVVMAIVCCIVIIRDRNALNTELVSVNAELSSTIQRLNSTQAELTSTKQTLYSVQNELGATKAKLETAEDKIKLYRETFGADVSSGVQPTYAKAGLSRLSREINLSNNPIARNPTWQELKEFLLADPTDDKLYGPFFTCGNFAEMLHNNAEAAGMRAAFVAVFFENDPIGHALNIFKTTDKGLVYVDCTGEGLFQLPTSEKREYGQSYPTEWDKIAYVVRGREYSSISLGKNTPLDYASYEKMKADWDSYAQKLEAYNEEVKEFNREISGKVYYIGTTEWQRIKEWERTLEGQKRVLDSLRAQLEPVWEPLGAVTSIEIYW